MRVLRKIISWFWNDWLMMESSCPPERRSPVLLPPSPAHHSRPHSEASEYDHIERRNTIFRQTTPHDFITDRHEQHSQFSNGQECNITKTLIVTASGRITKPSKIRGVCSECGLLADKLFACSVCRTLLCDRCLSLFKTEEGKLRPTCRVHYSELSNKFNTWKLFKAPKGRAK